MNRTRTAFALATLGGVVVLVGVALRLTGCGHFAAPDGTVADARFDGPAGSRFSLDDAHAFVGQAACAACHPHQVASLEKGGHAATLAFAPAHGAASRLDGVRFPDPERSDEFVYRTGPDLLEVLLPAKFGSKPFPLQFALGSGRHATTFVTLVPHRAGGTSGVEHRVSLYGPERTLGLTPGQRGRAAEQTVEAFGVVMSPAETQACLGCHLTRGTIREERIDDLEPGVRCEACHGPGASHARAVRDGRDDLAIALGRSRRPAIDRSRALEEMRICGRCHRTPEVLSAPPRWDDPKIVRFQPVGLQQSACFRLAPQGLSCTACHDPHAPLVTDAAPYERVCLSCHAPRTAVESPTVGRACPRSPAQGCVGCHMPRVSVPPGLTFADHWIRVRRDDDPPSANRPSAP